MPNGEGSAEDDAGQQRRAWRMTNSSAGCDARGLTLLHSISWFGRKLSWGCEWKRLDGALVVVGCPMRPWRRAVDPGSSGVGDVILSPTQSELAVATFVIGIVRCRGWAARDDDGAVCPVRRYDEVSVCVAQLSLRLGAGYGPI